MAFVAIHLDESTDISLCVQLIVFVKYVYNSACTKKSFFWISLETHTKVADNFEKFSSFIESKYLEWKNLVGCCTNEAPAILDCNSGF